MRFFKPKTALVGLALAGFLVPFTPAEAANVTLTFANVSGANGPAFTPFFVAFHDGTFDPFNLGAAASPAIEAVAELGSVAGLSADFAASHPEGVATTVTASVNGFGPGIFLPGATGSVSLALDPVKHRYLSYFSMVVPSNDRFLGNDSPTEIELFGNNGQLLTGVFEDRGDAVWDAGTEVDSLIGAAFIVGSSAADGTADNGVIAANTDFSVYSGVATPAGYNFTNLPASDSPLLRVSVSAVPIPAGVWLLGSALPALGLIRRRSRPAA